MCFAFFLFLVLDDVALGRVYDFMTALPRPRVERRASAAYHELHKNR